VNSSAPSTAETALNRKEYGAAEDLFRAILANHANDEDAQEGLVRALIGQNKVEAAAQSAAAWVAAEPASSMAAVALGEVRLRQGNPLVALREFQRGIRADRCNARGLYGVTEVEELAGMHAAARLSIEEAHTLHPTDNDIHIAWMETRPRKEQLEVWADYVEHSDQIDEEDRAKLKTRLAKESLYKTSDCRMSAASPREAAVAMSAVMDGPSRFVSWGLDVRFNGKRRRLQIDTGASGITITRAAARFMGIKREDATLTAGIGDKGKVKTSIAHVASIRIGGMEFTNCPVEILEKERVLRSDGLIGGDVFSGSELTLDFPRHVLRVAPLPDRVSTNTAQQITLDAAENAAAEVARDLYLTPKIAKWNRVFRSGSDLLLRARVVETSQAKDESAWREKLFLLDTGAGQNLISPQAAAEVTKVSRDWGTGVFGISGDVDKVYATGDFLLEFAGLRLNSQKMTAIDLTRISHDDGVEVSGLIGAPALLQVVLHINYRDNLVWCEYTPKK
jgi:predicted aspartyl protease